MATMGTGNKFMPTDWTGEPETLYFQSGTKKNKKGKKKPIYEIYDPAKAPEATPPGNMGPGGSNTGNAYGTNQTGGKTPTSTGVSSTFNSNYDPNINSYKGNAAPGSLASGLSNSRLPFISQDPYAIADEYMQSQGLQQGSASAALASNLYDPVAKSLGIMGGQGFSSDVDAINFGEQLMADMMRGTGEQLNGLQMMETALVAISKAVKDPLGSGGGMPSALAGIAAQQNPSEQLNSILGVVEGILKGTMPSDSAAALLSQMEAAGHAYISQLNKDPDPIASERAGKNMANYLLNWFQGKF